MVVISNHAIVDFIEKKLAMMLKKICRHFSFQLCYKIYNFSQHDDWNRSMISIYNYEYRPQQQKGTHWWRLLDLHQKKKEIFLFGSFGLEGFKEFILQDDRKTLNKILYRIKRFEKKGNYNNFDFFHEQIWKNKKCK